MAADIDPRYSGYEFWGASAAGLLDGQGQRIADAPSSVNHAVWWDANLLREIEDSNWINVTVQAVSVDVPVSQP